jgi:hypothetical protein
MSKDSTTHVLELIAEGFTPDAIARKIGRSKGTVGRRLKEVGTSYPEARRHFRRGGTVAGLLNRPSASPTFSPTQLDRIERLLEEKVTNLTVLAVNLEAKLERLLQRGAL